MKKKRKEKKRTNPNANALLEKVNTWNLTFHKIFTYHSGVLLQAPNIKKKKKKLNIIFWELRNLGFDNQIMEH